MNRHVIINTDEINRREAERRSIHELALEGIKLPSDVLALRERVMSGELTEAQYRAIILAAD